MFGAVFGDGCHHGSLALVSVAATAYDRDEFGTLFLDFVDGLDDILHGVGCVCVIDDGSPAFWASDGLEASVDGVERGEDAQHLRRLEAEAEGGTVDTEQVGDIEASDQRHEDLLVVDIQEHTVEAFFENLGMVVCYGACGVGMDAGAGVLGHDQAVLVVSVGYDECVGFETVEEALLGVAVVVEGLVVVDMIAREVGEECAIVVEPRNTLLRDGVAADFHEGVLAACVQHAAQQSVEFEGIWRGVRGGDGLVINVVADGGEQSCLVAHRAY